MLNDTGFQRQNYDDIVLEIEERARQIYGHEWSINDHSVIGMLIRIWAWFLAKHQQLIEKVYLSGFASTATGVSLDRVGGGVGLPRKQSAHAEVILTFTGTPSVQVPTQTLIQTEDGVEFWTTDVAVLNAQGIGTCPAVAVLPGLRGNVGMQTITQFVIPVQGVTQVTNENQATGGYELEPDMEYRKRLTSYQQGALNTTTDGIISKVSQVREVTGVQVRNLPSQGLWIIVDGGEETEVAQAIFDSVSAGVPTIGATVVGVQDIVGHLHTINFDKAEQVPISVQISLSVGANFSQASISTIKEEVQKYILSCSIGGKISYSRLFGFAYAAQGVESAELKLGYTNGINQNNNQDILLRENQRAVSGYIEVLIDG